MSERNEDFYVSIAAEVEEDDLVADIFFKEQQIAAIRQVASRSILTLYTPEGSNSFDVPARECVDALQDAIEQLQRSGYMD